MARTGWADCSAEIHLLIFKALFQSTPVTIKFDHKDDFDNNAQCLLTLRQVTLVCKEFHSIATAIFFAETPFFIDDSAVREELRKSLATDPPDVRVRRMNDHLKTVAMDNRIRYGSLPHLAIDIRIKNLTWHWPKYYPWFAHRQSCVRRKLRTSMPDLWPLVFHYFRNYVAKAGLSLTLFTIDGYPLDGFKGDSQFFELALPVAKRIDFEILGGKEIHTEKPCQDHVFGASITENRLKFFESKNSEIQCTDSDLEGLLFSRYKILQSYRKKPA